MIGLLLCVFVSILLYLIFGCVAKRLLHCNDSLAPLPYTVLTVSLLLYIVMELLSVGHWITAGSLTAVWSVILVLCGIAFAVVRRKTGIKPFEIKAGKTNARQPAIIFLILAFSAFMIFFALKTPLYNWDSMCYHLTRVAMWAQNHSVGHYATLDLREISSPVLAEMNLLNIYVLAGQSDFLFNLPQCIAYLLDAVLVFAITRKLGCKTQWAVVAAVLFLGTPIAFAEALTTQNDLITALQLLSTIYIIIDCVSMASEAKLNSSFIFRLVFLGIGISMSYHAKYYVLIPIAFFLIWLILVYLRQNRKWKVIVASVLIVLSVALIVYLPEGIRMYSTFGSLGSGETSSGQLTAMRPDKIIQTFFMNFFFNFSSHYIRHSDRIALGIVQAISKAFHLGLGTYSLEDPFVYDHDAANGFSVCVLFLLAIPFVIIRAVKEKKFPVGYITVSFISLVVFLAVTHYTPHRTRYELVFFAVLIPALCRVFQNANIREGFKHGLMGIIVFVSVCEIASCSVYHWFFTRYTGDRGYFVKPGDAVYSQYGHIADICEEEGFKTLGININAGSYKYPLMAMLKDTVTEVQYISVDNVTRVYENEEFIPDAVIFIDHSGEYNGTESGTIELHGARYSVMEALEDAELKYCIAKRD